jgi:SCY1-like protein 2
MISADSNSVIKSLGARVEREHIEHLRAVRKAEAQTASLGMQNTGWELGHESTEVDFETLVGRSSASTPRGVENGASTSMLDDWGNDMDWLQPKADPVPVRECPCHKIKLTLL